MLVPKPQHHILGHSLKYLHNIGGSVDGCIHSADLLGWWNTGHPPFAHLAKWDRLQI